MSFRISLNFVPKGPMNNIPSLVQIMAWRRPGNKPLSEPMMVGLPMHICVSRPQWVKSIDRSYNGQNDYSYCLLYTRTNYDPILRKGRLQYWRFLFILYIVYEYFITYFWIPSYIQHFNVKCIVSFCFNAVCFVYYFATVSECTFIRTQSQCLPTNMLSNLFP